MPALLNRTSTCTPAPTMRAVPARSAPSPATSRYSGSPPPPTVLEGVYTDDQYERIVDLVKRNGPWPTIVSHHFKSVEELVATSSGVVPERIDITLDDVVSAHFRGFLAQNSVAYFPELED